VIVLDAYALVALLGDEAAAPEVDSLLRQSRAAISSVNLAEAIDVACRVHDLRESDLRLSVEPLLHDRLDMVIADEEQAWRAAGLRVRHYDRQRSPLSLADCFLLASAATGDGVATSDEPVARAARAEGVDVVALPDSRGRRP
jgi:PIN domain nuclease of toxin-antitoxin system